MEIDWRTEQQARASRRWRIIMLASISLFVVVVATVTWIGVRAYLYDSRADSHFDNALVHIATDDPGGAIIELKNTLAGDPGNTDARLMLARLYVDFGYAVEARKEVDRLSASRSTSTELRAVELRLWSLEGNHDAVERELQHRDLKTLDPSLRALLGQARLSRGDTRAAAVVFAAIAVEHPERVAGHLGLARTHAAEGEFEAAEAALMRALELSPSDHDVHLLAGEVALERGDAVRAQSSFRLVLARKPASLAARAGLIRGALLADNTAEARKQAELLTAAKADDPVGHYFLALIALSESDFKRARTSLRLVLGKRPQHVESRYLLVVAYIGLGELDQAEEELTAILDKDPQADEFRPLLSEVLLLRGDPDRAVLALLPGANRRAADAQYQAALGDAYFKRESYHHAKGFLKQAVALAPSNAAFRGRLAVANLVIGNDDEYFDQISTAARTSTDSSAAETAAVIALLQRAELDAAMTQAERLADKYPDKPMPLVLMGGIYEAHGEVENARSHYQQALRLDAGHSAAALNLARLAIASGDLDLARTTLTQAHADNPHDATVLMLLADIEIRTGDVKSAVTHLESVRNHHPADLRARLRLAALYAKLGQSAHAVEVAEEAYAITPHDAGVLFQVGRARLTAGRFQGSVDAFTELSRQYPDNADAHFFLGSAWLKLGDVYKAAAEFERTVQLDSTHLPARYEMGNILLRKQRYDEARSVALEIIEVHPSDARGHTLQGDASWGLERWDEALDAYLRAFDHEPANGLVIRLSETYRQLGDRSQATRVLGEWLLRHPSDSVVRMAYAQQLSATGEHEHAIDQYQLLVERQPNNALALNNLAWLHYELGNEQALVLAAKAHDLAPDNAALKDTYGWLLIENGRTKEGVELLRTVVVQGGADVSTAYHYAVGLSKVGRDDEAADWLRELLDSGESFDERESAIALLESLVD